MILPMSKQMKLLYIESCKQVAADATGCKKGFRKKFRICNVFVLWAAAAMPTLYPILFIHAATRVQSNKYYTHIVLQKQTNLTL